MRLRSIHLRRYRIHADLRVEFDPSRTLIGGMNESGKSTLAEAIHRVLFLKANGNSQLHRSLASDLHGSPPEVELVFEAGGRVHTLTKRFGASGTVTLASGTEAPLQGDAAQEALHQLLHLEVDGSSRSIEGLWAHLWVWQGESTLDPSPAGSHPSTGLAAQLALQGGAAAFQSATDMAVARKFAEACGAAFTANQKPKNGSPLAEADAALHKAQAQLEAAKATVTHLADASRRLKEATRELEESRQCLTEQATAKARLDKDENELATLRKQEALESTAAQKAKDLEASLIVADTRIREVEAEIQRGHAAMAPLEAAVRRHDADATAARQAHADRDREHREAEEALRAARLRRDLADARVRCQEKAGEQSRLLEREKKIRACGARLAQLRTELAGLPALESGNLRELERLQSDLKSAQAALEAMATGIELLSAHGSVLAGDQPLAVGQSLILTRTTEILLEPGTRLRIQPGGGSSLEAARARESELRDALRRQLDGLGLDSVAAAVKVLARREALINTSAQCCTEWQALGGDTIDRDVEAAGQDLAAARAAVERVTALLPPGVPPSETDPAQAAGVLAAADAVESSARQARDMAMKRLNEAEVERRRHAEAQVEAEQHLNQRKAELEWLVQMHGPEEVRTRAIEDARIQLAQASNQLAATSRSIALLDPDAIQLAVERVRRAKEKAEQQRNQAVTDIEVQKALLRLDGSADPVAEQAAAEARVQAAAARHQAALVEAKALQLLASLFQDEQQALSARFTAPLVERMKGYLQCLFGPDVQVFLKLADHQFQGLRVYRPGLDGQGLDFPQLSGGAKEQFAAALRLAMAEILAAAHDRCLPVVFDDTFSFSDPERLAEVQRMLDLAASRGLQIIVLSCNPARFASLGAEPVRLHRQVVTGLSRANLPAVVAPLDSGTPAGPASVTPPSAAVVADPGQAAQFLEVLRAGGGSMGNTSLRMQLGWDEAPYAAVKKSLLEAGRIIPGRGRGGSVALTEGGPGGAGAA
jgi:DNA repair exonuclease SbcCD ATPase subunit